MNINHLELVQLSVKDRLEAVNATVSGGQLVHLIGPNGAGKSSLLLRLAGLIDGDGEVRLGGKAISHMPAQELSLYRACLIQQQTPESLIPVFAYLGLFALRGVEPKLLDKAVHTLCDCLYLSDKLTRPISQLSGGEWQRVRLAAVFLQIWPELNPYGKLLVLDEPMSSLDIVQQIALDRLIAFVRLKGILVISSSHELNHTLHHADEVWMIKKGKLIQRGYCKEVMQPQRLNELFDAQFTWGQTDSSNYLSYSL